VSIPLLATKMFLPSPVKNLVLRPRLLEKLSEGLQSGCRLTLVSAPAGFGKTTLVSTWVTSLLKAADYPPVAWLSLDEGDNDPAIFWTYLITTLQNSQAGLGAQALSLLQVAAPLDLKGVLALLVNSLVGLTRPFVLILDDYHLIRNGEIHKSLSDFIEHFPAQFHLLILSRTDPPLPLALLRGRGHLVEVRLAELRFSNEEAMLYLNEGMKLALPAQAVDTLNTKTEGWAAGLQMAGISIQGRQDPAPFIQTFSGSNRYVLDYLTDEILDRQPDEVRQFLLHTAVLDKLCGPLCDAVLGGPSDSRARLEQLERANLFLLPLDQERLWYRYHHLFADLLRSKLVQSEPGLLPVLQKRAAQWCEANGMLEEAVTYTHAAQDQAGLVRLIEQNIMSMMRAGRMVTLGHWVRLVPEDLVLNRPWLCLLSGWLLVGKAEFERGAVYLDRAEEMVRQGMAGNEAGEIQGIIYALRTQVFENRGDIQGTIETAQHALERMDPGNMLTRASVDYSLGRAYYASGDLDRADQVWSEFLRISLQAGSHSIYAIIMGIRSNLVGVQGKLQEAIQINRQAIEYMLANDISRFFLSGNPYLGLGVLSLQRNDLVEADQHIGEGMQLNRGWGNLNAIAIGLCYQARLRIAQGELEAAWTCLHEVEEINRRYRPYFEVRNHYLAGCTRGYLAKGEIETAARLVKELGPGSDDPLSFAHEQDHITLARVLVAQGSCTEAEGLLSRLAEAARVGRRIGRLVEILALQAVALSLLGRGADAVQTLETCLSLAEPEGYVRVFIDEGESMAKLLEGAAQYGKHAKYARQLLAAFSGASLQLPAPGFPDRSLSLMEPLSGRELEVLRLIAAGLANKQIAQRLCISVRTVKYHTTNIYTKLEVDGRAQAIIRAREFRLLK
jgi:LuxR family maltose regulon positive regulatory protein